MSQAKPGVSIGIPVFNGELYIAETLDSLLAQTYTDFEIIISDNASTDRTEEICRQYAAKDRRIRYYRNEKNLGAARNYNRVFELSNGKYFKWAAHDDICAPEYLERCVEVLDRKPSVVVCHTKTIYINKKGEKYKAYDDYLDFRSSRPHKRYHDYVFLPIPRWNAVFGVMRASELKKTPLIGSYLNSDKVLVGELVLRGEIYRVPEPLFFRRDHPQRPWQTNPTLPLRQAEQAWYDPTKVGKSTFRTWRLFREHLFSIGRVSLSWYERTWCYIYMAWWVKRHWRDLARDLILQ